MPYNSKPHPSLRATEAYPSSKSGVALVIALGLLSLLLITGVAFTIMMRIERSGSSNLRHTISARQMVYGGMAYAIAALDHDIGDKVDPGWSNRVMRTTSGRIRQPKTDDNYTELRIPEDVLLSLQQDENDSDAVALARVLTTESARYLPGALRYRAEITRQGDDRYAEPEWIPVYSADKATVGRYAYVILDTTDSLDANLVDELGNEHKRWMGADPAEIKLHTDIQQDLDPANGVTKFRNDRATHGRYDSLPELANNSGFPDNGEAIQNFDVFSYTPPDLMPLTPSTEANPSMTTAHNWLYDNNTAKNELKGDRNQGRAAQKINLAGDYNNLKSRRNIIVKGFEASGLTSQQALWAYLGLLDYVNTPGQLPAGENDTERYNRPATVPAPLFCNFSVRINYEYRDLPGETNEDDEELASHKLTFQLIPLFYYPFLGPANQVTIETKVKFLAAPVNEAGGQVVPDELLGLFNLSATGEFKKTLRQNVKPSSFGELFPLMEEVSAGEIIAPKRLGRLQGNWIFAMFVEEASVSSPSGILRRWRKSGANFLELAFVTTDNDILQASAGGTDFWVESLDPRYNWNFNSDLWRSNRRDAPSMGTMPESLEDLAANNIFDGYTVHSALESSMPIGFAAHFLANSKALRDHFKVVTDGIQLNPTSNNQWPTYDQPLEQFRAYVKNDRLDSVGELGYLPIGMWLSINLFDHQHNSSIPQNPPNSEAYRHNYLPPANFHRVLDYFRVTKDDSISHGKVNLNSTNPEVLGAVFNQLPLRTEYPENSQGSPGPALSTVADVVKLAEWIIEKGPYDRLSDIGHIFGAIDNRKFPFELIRAPFGSGNYGEFEREAIIRNSIELMTLRGRKFTIILRADAFAPTFGMTGVKHGNVLATASAVAQVWRDTVPKVEADGTKTYPTFIQFFKIIDE